MNIYNNGWCCNIKKTKYTFYNNRKECLKENVECNYWENTHRKYKSDYNNSYMCLISPLIVRLEKVIGDKLGSSYPIHPTQYYVDDEYVLYFTLSVPITKQTVSEDWLDSMNMIEVYHAYDKFFFKLCPLIIKGDTRKSVGKLTMLYKEIGEV